MRNKFYSMYGKATDSEGNVHYVTVVGNYYEEKVDINNFEEVEVPINERKSVKGTLFVPTRTIKRNFKIGYSICSPDDEFIEEVGIAVAKSRLKRNPIGEVHSYNITMLNEDSCELLLFGELKHISKHIDEYIQKT